MTAGSLKTQDKENMAVLQIRMKGSDGCEIYDGLEELLAELAEVS